MFFPAGISESVIMEWCEKQIPAVMSAAKHGIDVSIKPHKKLRTLEQNDYWWLIMDHIHDFSEETGWRPKQLSCLQWLAPKFLHEFFKAIYGIETTTKLSTKEFYELTNRLQNDMITTTRGEYEPIIPPDKFLDYYNQKEKQ